MKSKLKKMKLRKETLRLLDDRSIDGVKGGDARINVGTSCIMTCPMSCGSEPSQDTRLGA